MKFAVYGLWEEERAKLEELSTRYGFEYEPKPNCIKGGA